MRPRRVGAAVAGVAVTALVAYALASTTTGPGQASAEVACSGRLTTLSGRVPAGVSTAYLVAASGASVQTPVRGGRYRFVVTATPAGWVRLEYQDPHGVHHEVPIAGAPIHRCAALAARPVRIVVSPTPFPARRPTGESAGSWALTLVNEATIHVRASDPGCGLDHQVPQPQPTVQSQNAPSPGLLALFGVLRRAPTVQELNLSSSGFMPFGPLGVFTAFARYTRIIHGPGGLLATVATGQGQESVPAEDLPPCQTRVNAYLGRLLAAEPRDVRFYALQYRRDFKLGTQATGIHPWLGFSFGRSLSGAGGGGPVDLARLAASGLGFGSSQTAPGRSLIAGLVPDGVTSVTLRLPPHVSPLFHTRYPRAFAATAPVVDNAYFFAGVPRDPAVAVGPNKLIWRGRGGRVVRVVTGP